MEDYVNNCDCCHGDLTQNGTKWDFELLCL